MAHKIVSVFSNFGRGIVFAEISLYSTTRTNAAPQCYENTVGNFIIYLLICMRFCNSHKQM